MKNQKVNFTSIFKIVHKEVKKLFYKPVVLKVKVHVKKSNKYFTIHFTISGFKPMVLEAHGIFPWYLER